jgi:stress-induced morphogen
MTKEKGLQKASESSLVHLGEFESESFVGNGSVRQRSMVYSMLSEMDAQMKLSCRDSKMV